MQKQSANHPLAIRKYTIGEARDWMVWEGVALADVVNEDETPAVKLGAVGFLRAPWGVTTSFEFAYDEVLVVTKGRCTVAFGEEELTAGRGEIIYLPAGTPGSFRTEEDTELVYVASSPYGEVNRLAKASAARGSRVRAAYRFSKNTACCPKKFQNRHGILMPMNSRHHERVLANSFKVEGRGLVDLIDPVAEQ